MAVVTLVLAVVVTLLSDHDSSARTRSVWASAAFSVRPESAVSTFSVLFEQPVRAHPVPEFLLELEVGHVRHALQHFFVRQAGPRVVYDSEVRRGHGKTKHNGATTKADHKSSQQSSK